MVQADKTQSSATKAKESFSPSHTHTRRARRLRTHSSPGAVQPSTDQQNPHTVSIKSGHLKLQLGADPRPGVAPGFHGNEVGFGNAGVEAAVHQAADMADAEFIDLPLPRETIKN